MINQTLRIIGGTHRGRKITFPNIQGLRPTPDRVRETLFNWLSSVIAGANCLDCFAGSGALGLEAASRGAKQVTLIDSHFKCIANLEQAVAQLKFNNVDIIRAHLPATLNLSHTPVDIIFLDPPFEQNLLPELLNWLTNTVPLAPNAYLYLEAEKNLNLDFIPAVWSPHRHKVAGQVQYGLWGY